MRYSRGASLNPFRRCGTGWTFGRANSCFFEAREKRKTGGQLQFPKSSCGDESDFCRYRDDVVKQIEFEVCHRKFKNV